LIQVSPCIATAGLLLSSGTNKERASEAATAVVTMVAAVATIVLGPPQAVAILRPDVRNLSRKGRFTRREEEVRL
jgi:hypothetical protein